MFLGLVLLFKGDVIKDSEFDPEVGGWDARGLGIFR